MKKESTTVIAVALALIFLVSGCVQQRNEKLTESLQPSYETVSDEDEMPKGEAAQPQPLISQLGSLCSGEEECKEFCLNNRGRCEEYCKGNTKNELCRIIFPTEEPRQQEIVAVAEKRTGSERQEECKGTKTKFDYAPVNLDKTKVFLPLGLMAGGHVTPIDHHYFQNFDNVGYNIEIYSPGDGYITDVGHMPGAKNGEDYRIVIEHTCTISSIYIHFGTFAEKFKQYAPEANGREYARYKIPVKARELIGYYEKNVDYNLVDEEVTLTGFVVPEHYEGESWKIHVPNTYDYFNEPVRSELIEKSVRTVEPISGKIDYDIDGKLVGNWFAEGTYGYAGSAARTTATENYWRGHLSMAYDAYDPERIVVSMGDFNGEAKQFGVKENSPDPAKVGIEDGLVKYELIEYDYITPSGSSWDRKSLVKGLKTKSYDNVQGVVLVQMIEKRKIRFEAFPGKTASQVRGFTENAKIYER